MLVLVKGKNRTEDIEYIEETERLFNIKYYNNDKIYRFYKLDVEIDKYIGEIILEENQVVYVNDFPFNNVSKMLVYEIYYKIYFKNNKNTIAKKIDTKIMNSADDKGLLEYFKEIATCIEESNCGEFDSFLKNQYDKLAFINEESALAQYLNGSVNSNNEININKLIFPFNFNLSQRKATEAAFTSSISVIEGPPGTGKTQTILNIIANIIINNKTVAIVSNNNEAFKNVYEKLEKDGLGFICAQLGKADNIKKFFQELSNGVYDFPDDFKSWQVEDNQIKDLEDEIISIQNDLEDYLENKNKLAILNVEKAETSLEYEYFKKITEGRAYQILNSRLTEKLDIEKIISFLVDNELYLSEVNKLSFFNKIRFFLKHKIKDFKELASFNDDIVLQYQDLYYQKKIRRLDDEIKKYSNKIETSYYKEIIKKLHLISNIYFRSHLYNNLVNSIELKYLSKENYKNKFRDFMKRFPVILSTTHSIKNCIRENCMFDYIIIDEASQGDLLSSGLALSCAKNVVVVGDLKQLHFIVEDIVREKVKSKLYDKIINNDYDYLNHSILSSIKNVYRDEIPITFLQEHYRCNNFIIQFCNKKFYDNKLIPLSNNQSINPLILYRCQPGNHSRIIYHGEKGIYNLRQIEMVEEVLNNENFDESSSDIGFIAPFRKQVLKAKSHLDTSILSDTVHKFQGREKDTIIFSTVLDKVKSNDRLIEFVDNSNLVNVAVSRAINAFILITDNNLFLNKGNNIGDLMRYIEYNFQDYCKESEIVSVFDLLYKEYSEKLLKFKKKLKKRADIESENLIYNLLEDILECKEYNNLDFKYQVKLSNLVKLDKTKNEREIRFLNHHKTSADFVIYNKFNKQPVLVIEVDSVKHHEDNPEQIKRDKIKNELLERSAVDILRLPSNGSREKEKIIRKLDTIKYQ